LLLCLFEIIVQNISLVKTNFHDNNVLHVSLLICKINIYYIKYNIFVSGTDI